MGKQVFWAGVSLTGSMIRAGVLGACQRLYAAAVDAGADASGASEFGADGDKDAFPCSGH